MADQTDDQGYDFEGRLDTIRAGYEKPADKAAPADMAPAIAAPPVGTTPLAKKLDDDGTNDLTQAAIEAGKTITRDDALQGSTRGALEDQLYNDQKLVDDTRNWAHMGADDDDGSFVPKGDYGVLGQSFGILDEADRRTAAQAELERAEQGEASSKAILDFWEKPADSNVAEALKWIGLKPIQAALARGFKSYADKRLANAEAMNNGQAPLPSKTAVRDDTESFVQGVGTTVASVVKAYGIARGYSGLAGRKLGEAIGTRSPTAGLTIDPADDPIYKFGQAVQDFVVKAMPGDQGRQFEWRHQIAQGAGTSLAFMGPGAFARLVGAGEKGVLAVIAMTGMASNGSQAFDDVTAAMKKGTATERDRIINTLADTVIGASEALPFMETFGKAFPNVTGFVGRRIIGGIEQGVEEAVQGSGQQLLQNIVQKYTYTPNIDLTEGLPEQLVAGLGAGGLYGGLLGSHANVAHFDGEAAAAPEGTAAVVKKPKSLTQALVDAGDQPPPEKTITPEQASEFAQQRLAVIEAKAKGQPGGKITGDDGKPVDVPASGGQILNTAEREERDFLKTNADKPEAIARAYGLAISPGPSIQEEPGAAASEAPEPIEGGLQLDATEHGVLQAAMQGLDPTTAALLDSASRLPGPAFEALQRSADAINKGGNEFEAARDFRRSLGLPELQLADTTPDNPLAEGANISGQTAEANAQSGALSGGDGALTAGENALPNSPAATLGGVSAETPTGSLGSQPGQTFVRGRSQGPTKAEVFKRQTRFTFTDQNLPLFVANSPEAVTQALGQTNHVVTPDGAVEFEVAPEIVDLADLKLASADLQPRDRNRVESEAGVRSRAANLDPARLMPGRVSDSGAPIISPDGTIISGNGRVMSIAEAYNDPALQAQAERYKAALGPEAAGMERPVLVQRMTGSPTRAQLVRIADLSNRGAIAGMSATERAMRDSRAAGPEIMGLYTGGSFTSHDNRHFFRAFMNAAVTDAERPEIAKNGVLTKTGDDRLTAAVLAAAYGDPALLSRMLEDTDDNIRNITGALRDVAGDFIRLKQAITDGRTGADMDITPQIVQTAKIIADLRERKISPRTFLSQQDAFNQVDPMVESLLKAFYNEDLSRALSREKLTEVLARYAQEAEKHAGQSAGQGEAGGGQAFALIPDETTADDVLRVAARAGRDFPGLFSGGPVGESDGGPGAGAAERGDGLRGRQAAAGSATVAGEGAGADVGGFPHAFISHVVGSNSLDAKSRAALAADLGLGKKDFQTLLDDAVKQGWLRKDGRGAYRRGPRVTEARVLQASPQERAAIVRKEVSSAVDEAVDELGHLAPSGTNIKTFSNEGELPSDIQNAAKAIGEGGRVEGISHNGDIWLATYALSPRGVFGEEIYHALKDRDMVSEAEEKLLAKAAYGSGVFDRARYERAYADRGLSPAHVKAIIQEEAAGHFIKAAINGDVTPKATKGIVERIKKFFKHLAQTLGYRGFNNEWDVAGDLLAGRMTARNAGFGEGFGGLMSGARFSLSDSEREAKARGVMANWENVGRDNVEPARDTSKAENYGTPAWSANREYVDGKTYIRGFDKVVDHFLAKAESKLPGGEAAPEHRAFIVMGYPGSGKSSTSKVLGWRYRAAALAGDDAKLLMPEYQNGFNNGGVKAESDHIAAAAAAKLAQRGGNMIIETSGNDLASVKTKIETLKQAGYQTNVVYVDVPKGMAMERAVKRYEQNGRPVPLSLYDRGNARENYETLKREGLANESARITPHASDETQWSVHEVSPGLDALRGDIERAPTGTGPGGRVGSEGLSGGVQEARPNLGPLFSIAGSRAVGANLSSRDTAERLEDKGVKPENILKQTGWFRGKDRQWKFEIDDSKAKIVDIDKHLAAPKQGFFRSLMGTSQKLPKWVSGKVRIGRNVKLADIYHHPELYKAYPFLKNMRVSMIVGPGVPAEREGGALLGRREDGHLIWAPISVFAKKTDDIQDTLSHEIQHYIQHKEGFATGADMRPRPQEAQKINWSGNAVEDFGQPRSGKFLTDSLANQLSYTGGSRRIEMTRAETVALQLADLHDLLMKDQGSRFVPVGLQDLFSGSSGALSDAQVHKAIEGREAELAYLMRAAPEDYLTSAGEAEANDTMNRQNLTAEQRRDQLPPSAKQGLANRGPQDFESAANEMLRRAAFSRRASEAAEKPVELGHGVVVRQAPGDDNLLTFDTPETANDATPLVAYMDWDHGRAVLQFGDGLYAQHTNATGYQKATVMLDGQKLTPELANKTFKSKWLKGFSEVGQWFDGTESINELEGYPTAADFLRTHDEILAAHARGDASYGPDSYGHDAAIKEIQKLVKDGRLKWIEPGDEPAKLSPERLSQLVDEAETYLRRRNLTPTADLNLIPPGTDRINTLSNNNPKIADREFKFWAARDPYHMAYDPRSTLLRAGDYKSDSEWKALDAELEKIFKKTPHPKGAKLQDRIMAISDRLNEIENKYKSGMAIVPPPAAMPDDLLDAHLDPEAWKARHSDAHDPRTQYEDWRTRIPSLSDGDLLVFQDMARAKWRAAEQAYEGAINAVLDKDNRALANQISDEFARAQIGKKKLSKLDQRPFITAKDLMNDKVGIAPSIRNDLRQQFPEVRKAYFDAVDAGGDAEAGFKEIAARHLKYNSWKAKRSGPLFALNDETKDVDQLGFYSEAARKIEAWPQTKGTPEQILRLIGKENEVKATGLDKFLQGRKLVTKREALDYLNANRVILNETRYGGTDKEPNLRLNNRTRLENGDDEFEVEDRESGRMFTMIVDHDAGNVYVQRDGGQFLDVPGRVNNQSQRDGLRAITDYIKKITTPLDVQGPAAWTGWSLDPENPSYRETALHMPWISGERRAQWTALNDQIDKFMRTPLWSTDRATAEKVEKLLQARNDISTTDHMLSFDKGHFDQRNVVAHIRSAMYKTTDDKRAFLLDELQSDWAQKIRDHGARDQEKAEQLRQLIDVTQEERSTLRDEIANFIRENDQGIRDAAAEHETHEEMKLGSVMENASPFQKLNVYASYGAEQESRTKAQALADELERLNHDMRRLEAEFSTANGNQVPPHPFVNSTDQWTTTALRRIISMAVDNGADGIAITPGQVQLDRYPSLSRVVDTIEFAGATQYEGAPGGVGRHIVLRNSSGVVGSGTLALDGTILNGYDVLRDGKGKNIAEYIGREWKDKLFSVEHGDEYDVAAMKVGGKGMLYAYDQMYPKQLEKILKKIDPSVKRETKNLKASNGANFYEGRPGSDERKFTYFPLTDKIKDAIRSNGQPLFAIGDNTPRARVGARALNEPVQTPRALAAWFGLDPGRKFEIDAAHLTADSKVLKPEDVRTLVDRTLQDAPYAIRYPKGNAFSWTFVVPRNDGTHAIVGAQTAPNKAGKYQVKSVATLPSDQVAAQIRSAAKKFGADGFRMKNDPAAVSSFLTDIRQANQQEQDQTLDRMIQALRQQWEDVGQNATVALKNGQWTIVDGAQSYPLGLPETDAAQASKMLDLYREGKAAGPETHTAAEEPTAPVYENMAARDLVMRGHAMARPAPTRHPYGHLVASPEFTGKKSGEIAAILSKRLGRKITDGAVLAHRKRLRQQDVDLPEMAPRQGADAIAALKADEGLQAQSHQAIANILTDMLKRPITRSMVGNYLDEIRSVAKTAAPQLVLLNKGKDKYGNQRTPYWTITYRDIDGRARKISTGLTEAQGEQAKAIFDEFTQKRDAAYQSLRDQQFASGPWWSKDRWLESYRRLNNDSERFADPVEGSSAESSIDPAAEQSQPGVPAADGERSAGTPIRTFTIPGHNGYIVERPDALTGLRQRWFYTYGEKAAMGMPATGKASPSVTLRVMKSFGNWSSRALANEVAPGTWEVNLGVRGNRRRRGIGTALAEAVRNDIGGEMSAWGSIKKPDFSFWQKADPSAIANYQRLSDGMYYSPRHLTLLRNVMKEIAGRSVDSLPKAMRGDPAKAAAHLVEINKALADVPRDVTYRVRDDLDPAHRFAEIDARADAEMRLGLGETVQLGEDHADRILAALDPVAAAVPGARVGALLAIEPSTVAGAVTLAFQDSVGGRFRINIPHATIFGGVAARAFTFGNGAGFGIVRLTSRSGESPRIYHRAGWHEAVHVLRSTNNIPELAFRALVGHGQNLGVMALSPAQIGVGAGDATLQQVYQEIYRGRPNLQELLDQEAAAHLAELAYDGFYSDADIAPVKAIINQYLPGLLEARDAVATTDPLFAIGDHPADAGGAWKAKLQRQGFDTSKVWYHGSARVDRVAGPKEKLSAKRATSGPMPYFSDSPQIASNYATAKVDTSLDAEDTGDISSYFTVDPKSLGLKGARTPISVERSWHFLTPKQRATITERATRIGYEIPDTSEGDIVLHPVGTFASLSSPGHWEYTLNQENRGNALAALRDLWYSGGALVDEPEELLKIWKLAGYPAKVSMENAPWTEAAGVIPVYLKMQKPLVTSNHDEINNVVLPALEEAVKYDRTRTKESGMFNWAKTARYTPREWVADLKKDMANGGESERNTSYVFTSIPDKITDALKALGYDGILDNGGKMAGGAEHAVAIPFAPEQVASTVPRKAGGPLFAIGDSDADSEAARKARANAMGFDTSKTWYHGTDAAFSQFDKSFRGSVTDSSDAQAAFWFTTDKNRARQAARDAMNISGVNTPHFKNGVLSTYLRVQNPLVVNEPLRNFDPEESAALIKKAEADGHDGVLFTHGEGNGSDMAVFDPKNIRSVDADFDPSQSGSSNIKFSISDTDRNNLEGGTATGVAGQPPSGTTTATGEGGSEGENPQTPGLSAIIRMLSNSVAVPIRLGRLPRVPGARVAQVYTPEGVARIRDVDNIHQAATAVAAHLERTMGPALAAAKAAHAPELLALADEIGGSDLSQGFARFFDTYLSSYMGRYAYNRAPGFYDAFENTLDRMAPRTLQGIQATQEAYGRYTQADASDRLRSGIIRPEVMPKYRHQLIDRAKAEVATLDPDGRGSRFGFVYAAEKKLLSDGYRNFVSKNFAGAQLQKLAFDLHEENTAMPGVTPAERLMSRMNAMNLSVDQIADQTNIESTLLNEFLTHNVRPSDDNLDKLGAAIGRSRSWLVTGRDRISRIAGEDLWQKLKQGGNLRAWVENAVRYGFMSRTPNADGTFSRMGPGYVEVMAKVMNGEVNDYDYDDEMQADFDTYLVARRAADTLYPRFKQGLIPARPVRESEAEVHTIVNEMLAKHPHFQEAADYWDRFTQSWLNYAHESGLLSDEQLDQLSQDKSYAPFARDLSDTEVQEARASMSGNKADAARPVFFRLQGSDRNIMSPTATMLGRITTLVQRSFQQDVAKNMDELIDIAGPGIGVVMERVPATDIRIQQVNAREALRKIVRAAGLEMDDVQVVLDAIADVAGDPSEMNSNSMGAQFNSDLSINMATERAIKPKPGETLIPYRDNGELKFISLHGTKSNPHLAQDIFTTFSMAGQDAMPPLMGILRAAAQVRRASITSWPGFILRNLVIDPITHFALFRMVKFPGQSHYEGLKAIKRGDPLLKAYTSQTAGSGVLGGTLASEARRGINEQSIEHLIGKPTGLWEKIRHGFEKLGEISEFSETLGRVGLFTMAYKRAKAYGMSDYEALQEAGATSTDVMNYAESGRFMGFFRSIMPFFNAGIVGTDKELRTVTGYSQHGFAIKNFLARWVNFGDRQKAWDSLSNNERDAVKDALAMALKATLGFAVADMVAWALWHDDDEWRDKSDQMQDTHWVIPSSAYLPLIPEKDRYFFKGQGLRIPKPFAAAIPGNIVRIVLDNYAKSQGGTKAAERIAASILRVMMPPVSLPGTGDIGALQSNRDPFSGRDIVPDYMQRYNPEDQSTPYTSSMGNTIGKNLKVSPAGVDFVLKAMLGPWAKELMTLTDRFDPNKPALTASDAPVGLSRFVTSIGKGSQTLDDYYETVNPPLQLNTNNLMRILGYHVQAFWPAQNSYAKPFGANQLDKARVALEAMNANERIFSLMSVNWKGGKGDLTAEKLLHPLIRFDAERKLLGDAARDVVQNQLGEQATAKEKKQGISYPPVAMTGVERSNVLRILKHLQIIEAHDALVLMGGRGYENQVVQPPQPLFDELEAASPDAYREVMRRLDKGHILPFEAIQTVWPDVQRKIGDPALQDKISGSEAYDVRGILSGLHARAERDGRAIWGRVHAAHPIRGQKPILAPLTPPVPPPMHLGGPVPNPAGVNGSTDPDDSGIGYPTNAAPDNGAFDNGISQPPADAATADPMREINPQMPTALPPELQPPAQPENDVNDNRWKQRLM